MPLTSRQRNLRKRQRRVRKLRNLKLKLAAADDAAKRRVIIEKIRRIAPFEKIED
jgi:hypothetical protein